VRFSKHLALIFGLAFLVGVAAQSLVPRTAIAEGPVCECWSMAYCLEEAPPVCECPPNWAVILSDKSEYVGGECNGNPCGPIYNCGGGVGCLETCY